MSPAAGIRPATLEPATLGEALRLLRHRAALSRDSLASVAALSSGAVSNYENDVSSPSAAALRRLTHALADAVEQDVEALWTQLGALLDESDETERGRRDSTASPSHR